MKTILGETEKYITKDGSIIRELMHPDEHVSSIFSVKNQSLAEATVPAGVATVLHKHALTEELYHITSGKGLMTPNPGKNLIVTVSSGGAATGSEVSLLYDI